MISVFDMFKVGIGPSSSHTVGPMKAGKAFIDLLIDCKKLAETDRLQVDVYGSLALTGRGHSTDTAIIMGLMGYLPDNVDIERIDTVVSDVKQHQNLCLAEARPEHAKTITFDFFADMPFHYDFLPRHENGVTFNAFSKGVLVLSKTYYSIGGGFIVDDENFDNVKNSSVEVPFPYKNAEDILKHCKANGLPISSLVWKNELALRSKQEISDYLAKVWKTMDDCIEHGLHTEGLLPGPLKVIRRAPSLRRTLEATSKLNNDPMQIIDWINMYALAVNEENAAGAE